ncbi:methyltransferase family protein [Paraburkholderia silvatlantica]|nr:methyltransferase family protein [Paraburkholderia silvatlantica]
MNERYGMDGDADDFFSIFHDVPDAEWLEILKRSVTERVIKGIRFPDFPPDALQSQFVGSANENALDEAYGFFSELKKHAALLDVPVQRNSRVLDFGCGWGRYLRFFWKDVQVSGIFGVDIDPDILSVCHNTKVPGQLSRILPTGSLPFADGFFSHIMAYSVFTHLPEPIHLHWMEEIARVIQPGGTFTLTLEPRRFLNFVAEQGKNSSLSEWHKAMAKYAASVPDFLKAFDEGKLVYLPTGGGNHRDSDVYGDAAVPLSFIKEHWGRHFDIVEYIDDAQKFWQAVLVVRRRAD